MKWIKPPIESKSVRALAESYELDLLTASILTRRGVSSAQHIAFFLEEDERFLHNSFLFPDMEQAVERVLVAAKSGEKIVICGDKDVDGISSTVLMVEALRMLGIDPEWAVPLGNDDYGLNPRILEKKAEEGVTLVIAVDCGISNFEEVGLARRLGMDVLIFDHHVPRVEKMPEALAIINPKISGTYPFTGLCAAAVVSKFFWALCFSRTSLWRESFCLILAHKESEEQEIVVEVLRMRHGIEQGRLTVCRSKGAEDQEKILRFIEGEVLITYDAAIQSPVLSEFFGAAQVNVADMAPEIWDSFPKLRQFSLKELEGASRFLRYSSEQQPTLTLLSRLMTALHCYRNTEAFEPWRCGLDLVALGTLADLMPLKDENRILVRLGLARINADDGKKKRRVALRELLIKQRLHEGRVGTVEMAWQICPLINASGRMGKAAVGVNLFLEMDPLAITKLAEELVSLNKKRRILGEKFWNKLLPQAYESKKTMDNSLAIVSDKELPRGITGILASRMQKILDIPAAVVVSLQGDIATGSVRCNETMNVIPWLESMAPLLDDFGGHPQAGGFRLKSSLLEEFKSKTRIWLKDFPMEKNQKNPIAIDAELSHQKIVQMGMEGINTLLERLEPYGADFRPLIFLTRSVKILQVDLVGKPKNNHLKMLVTLGDKKWPALWWDAAHRYGKDVTLEKEIDLIYHIDRDRWRGVDAQRLTILEVSACGS